MSWFKYVIIPACIGIAVSCAMVHAKLYKSQLIEYRTVVQKGETLWDICGEIATDEEDLREIVYQTMEDNRIQDARRLRVGQPLVIRVEQARKKPANE